MLNVTGGVNTRVGLCTRADAHGVTACRRHGCAEGQYNPLASLMLNAPEPLIGTLFESRPDVLSAGVLVAFSMLYFFMLCIAYDASAVGGLFVPAMMIGASAGRCFAVLLRDTGWVVQPSVFALVGASAVMGGITRYTLAIVVLMIEATQNTSLLPPICLAVVTACLVANFFTHSINEHKLHRIGVPLIEDEMEAEMYDLMAADVMRRRVLTVRRYARVDKVYAYLLNSTHHGFPVVEHESHVMDRLRSTSVDTLNRTGVAAADQARQRLGIGAGGEKRFDNDLMMHSLNAGSLRDDDEFHVVPTANAIFKAGETSPKKKSKSPKKKSTPVLAMPHSPRVEDLSLAELAAPDEWHSPAHARRDAAAAAAATPTTKARPASSRLTRGESRMDILASSVGSKEEKEKERSHFTGMVTRAQLIHALATRTKHANIELAHAAAEVETAAEHARRLRDELCAAALHDKGLRKMDLKALDIQPHHHKMLIDLGPYIDDGVLSVTPNTPLGRVHRLFVSCGLRHLVVTDTDNEVSGIITRKDLTMQTNTVAFPQERPLVPAAVTRALSRRTSKDSNSSTQSSIGRLQNSLRAIAEDQSDSSPHSTPKLSSIAFSDSSAATV